MKKNTKTPTVTGWKVFDPNLKGRDFQYEIGKRYQQTGKLKLCHNGFHFHKNPSQLFEYYSFESKNRVCEIKAYGEVIDGSDKSCCNDIEIIRELTWDEVLRLINIGIGNTGRNNTGDRNTGNLNTGNRNTGNRNTGYWNTGNRNTGDCNTGDWNTGDWNTGDLNTGDLNTGNRNTGDRNTGDRNTGDRNTGNLNTGNLNTGNLNTGNRNTGNLNTGNRNTGNRNTGDLNTGNRNTGDLNTGDWNTGDWNTTNFSAGIFNTIEQPTPIFNGAAYVLMSEFKNTLEYRALFSSHFLLTEWIFECDMTDEEKTNNPQFYIQQGYLKKRTYEEACAIWWENMTNENKKLVQQIPGFTASIFTKVTGIEL